MILDEILATRRVRLAEAKRRVGPARLARKAERLAEARRLAAAERRVFAGSASAHGGATPRAETPLGSEFRASLAAAAREGGFPVIAEIKRASPSAGIFREDVPGPAALARAYRTGGAAALSVLTEPDFFLARPGDLESAVAASGLPALRKDFVIDPYQVDEAAVMGAAAVLLIVAALDDATLGACLARARDVGLDALVEVHDEEELGRALAAGAGLLGINNRDLRTFRTDLEVTERLAALAPKGALVVSESGIRGPDDVRRVARAGAQAVLVGESLVRSADPARLMRELRCATVPDEAALPETAAAWEEPACS